MGPWWVWGLVLAPGRWGQLLGCMIAGLWVRDLVLACGWVWPVPDIRCWHTGECGSIPGQMGEGSNLSQICHPSAGGQGQGPGWG